MEIKPGISLATVSAVLHTKDNKHVLQVAWGGWAGLQEEPPGPVGTGPLPPEKVPASQPAPRTVLPTAADRGQTS